MVLFLGLAASPQLGQSIIEANIIGKRGIGTISPPRTLDHTGARVDPDVRPTKRNQNPSTKVFALAVDNVFNIESVSEIVKGRHSLTIMVKIIIAEALGQSGGDFVDVLLQIVAHVKPLNG
jgi:hypothetical protein